MPNLIMAVGGTGGHIYPAIALAKHLSKEIPELKVLFMGGKLGQNRYFDKGEFAFHSSRCGSLSKNPLKLFQGGIDIVRGAWDCKGVIQDFKPNLVVGFGSYHSFPALAATAWSKTPFLLHESNSVPGKVNRMLAPRATLTGILFPSAAKHLKGNTQLVDMPLREGFRFGTTSKEEALAYFGLKSGKPTLLIFGGSQGAAAINKMAAEGLQGSFQVIHIVGSTLHLKQIKEAYIKKGLLATVKEFETRMDLAWQAADLAICRSGAGTLAEALEFEVPTFLIPYPHAADNHQAGNARWMAEEVQGGLTLEEKALNGTLLNQTVQNLLDKQLPHLQKKMRHYKQNQIRKNFSHLIKEYL